MSTEKNSDEIMLKKRRIMQPYFGSSIQRLARTVVVLYCSSATSKQSNPIHAKAALTLSELVNHRKSKRLGAYTHDEV